MGANAEAVRSLHTPGDGRLRRDPLFELLADDVEWFALGSPERLPWAGEHRGQEAVRSRLARLGDAMDYSAFELKELHEAGDTVVEVIAAAGRARATGRAFASEVVRIWTFREGRAVRVRSYYDTDAYAVALGGTAAGTAPG